jgi:DDE superfamily endonuclease
MQQNIQLNVQKKQKEYFSGKYGGHTLKSQLVIDLKTTTVLCVHHSKGKVHDYKLFKLSKLPINPNKKLLLDSGYQGVKKIHLNSDLPIKKSKYYSLTAEDKANNLKLSKRRVVVEHVIGKIKVFRIMAERYRNRRVKHFERVKLICGIYNFEL